MPSDRALKHVNWQHRTEPDDLPEWMDEPCSSDDLRACLHDLGQVNKLTLGYRPTLLFLDRLLSQRQPQAPLRSLCILDVGFGGGDALRRIAQWATAKGVAVELTGIDLNPFAATIAKERSPNASIEWLTGDAFAYGGEVDVVISSLLTHHLPTGDVVAFLRWMEAKASMGWFINDLERSPQSARLFTMLARVMRWHRFVQHDGPVSFARSFVAADWQRMLAESGVPAAAAEITPGFPSRLCVSRFK